MQYPQDPERGAVEDQRFFPEWAERPSATGSLHEDPMHVISHQILPRMRIALHNRVAARAPHVAGSTAPDAFVRPRYSPVTRQWGNVQSASRQ